MRLALAALVCVMALATQASGATETSTFTDLFLLVNNTDFAAARTFAISSMSAPDLNFNATGRADLQISMGDGGSALVTQGVNSTAGNNDGLWGQVSFYNRFTATQVIKSKAIMSGTSTSNIWDQHDYSKIETESVGLGMAASGSGNYSLLVDGGFKTVTNTVPALRPVSPVEEELEYTFEMLPMEFDEPIDLVNHVDQTNIETQNNRLTSVEYYLYETAREADTSCNYWMNLKHYY